VSDRFGDYGLVGVMIYETRGEVLDVETFLLSCRVLGRGVEHRMMAFLGEAAERRGLKWVDVHYHRSEKNKPALDFLEKVGSEFKQALNGGYVFRFPAGVAAKVTLVDKGGSHNGAGEHMQRTQSSVAADRQGPAFRMASERSRSEEFRVCRKIALEFNEPAKIHRAIEAKAARLGAGQGNGYCAPQTQMEKELCQFWQELLRIERVGVRDNFFDLGGHSLLAVRLFAKLQKLTGRKLPLVTLFQAPTIQQLARVLEEEDLSKTCSPVVTIQRGGSKPALFLVHGAGGDVLWGYANLAKHMDPDQPIYGIKSRGQVGMEEYTTLEEMAAYYVREIRNFQSHGPYYLGGYCFGGNVAYEMARQLKAEGEEIGLLILLDSAPANAGYEKMRWWQPSFPYRFLRNLYYWWLDFRNLPLKQQCAFVARKARAMGRKLLWKVRRKNGETEPVDLEVVIDLNHLPENEHRLWEIHLLALAHHAQQRYEDPVVLFRTRGQAMFCSLDDDLSWGRLVQGGVTVREIPGSHENIFMEPNVQHLAGELGKCLEETQKAKA